MPFKHNATRRHRIPEARYRVGGIVNLYRRFRLYLWGAAYEFLSRSLDCYRMIIHRPAEATDDPL
jgi:hypothetical protein